jgi:hypothetical protein
MRACMPGDRVALREQHDHLKYTGAPGGTRAIVARCASRGKTR